MERLCALAIILLPLFTTFTSTQHAASIIAALDRAKEYANRDPRLPFPEAAVEALREVIPNWVALPGEPQLASRFRVLVRDPPPVTGTHAA